MIRNQFLAEVKYDKLEQIRLNMKYILSAAKAYEAGGAIISDMEYDGAVKLLQSLEASHPQEFKKALLSYPMYEDGRWTMTGNFWRG